jgi:hypothetical protein
MNLLLKRASSPGHISLSLSDPFTVRNAPEGQYFIHPWLSRLADERLLLMINRDTDIMDMEYSVLASKDRGRSWDELLDWPMGDGNGRHLRSEHVCLADGCSLVTSRFLVATGGKNEYILPSWISSPDAGSWERLEPVPFRLPIGFAGDFFKPTPDLFGMYREQPTELMQAFLREYGNRWLVGLLWHLHVIDSSTILAFVYASTHPQRPGPRYVTMCLQSSDRGRSWKVRSIPGPYDPDYERTNRQKKLVDGLCEPSVTRSGIGDHLVVMRMGAWKNLYTARSADGCRTWTKPRAIPVFGILPTVHAMPSGIVALASGRPDNTVSFSFDHGASWPWTCRLLDQTDPFQPSTRNSTMIPVGADQMLYLYDRGYRRPDGNVDVPHGVEGRYVTVESVS